MRSFNEIDNMENRSISSADLIRLLSRRWWILVVCLACMLGAVVIYNNNATPVYVASSELIFEESERVMGSELTYFLKDKDNFIANQIEEIKTESFAKRVYDSLPTLTRDSLLTGPADSGGTASETQAVEYIKNNLSVRPTRGTAIIEISFAAREPGLAQNMANIIAEVLIERNLEIRRQKYSSLKGFVEQQFVIVKDRLREAERALKQFKQEHNITSLETETREILQRMTQAEILYNQVTSEKKELGEKVNVIRSKLDSEKSQLARNVIRTTDPLVLRLKEQLVDLEVQFANLVVQGIPKTNPKMLEIKRKIKQIKLNLVNETLKIDNDKELLGLVDPFSQVRKYLEELISLEADLQAHTAEAEHLRSLLAGYKETLARLPEKEMTLARLIRDVDSANEIYRQLLSEREKARLNEAAEIGNIRIIEPASLPVDPVRPRKVLNIIVVVFAALVVGTISIFGLEYLSDAVKTEEEVERALGVPVVVSIPRLRYDLPSLLSPERNGNGYQIRKSEAIISDECNLLYCSLIQRIQHRGATVLLTSSIPNEGKSTVAAMLAITCAQRGKRTLLIDADLRRPSLHSVFRIRRTPGLTNLVVDFMRLSPRNGRYLTNSGSTDQLEGPTLQMLLRKTVAQTSEKRLLLLPSGFLPANPVKAWSSNVWQVMFPRLKQIADVIIIDSPPLIGMPDASIIASYADHVLFCIAAGDIDRPMLKRSFKLLKNAVGDPESKIIGAVLNKIEVASLYGRYKYYRNYSQTTELAEVDHS